MTRISRIEAEEILLSLTSGVRPLVDQVLIFSEEGFRWVYIEELLPEEDEDE